jgi:hypothetical protein
MSNRRPRALSVVLRAISRLSVRRRLASCLVAVGLLAVTAVVPLAEAAVSGGLPATVREGEANPDPSLEPDPEGPETVEQPPVPESALPGGNRSAFNRPGMWIWYLSSSHGGNYREIIRQARAAGIGTLYIKSADGRNVWSQFTTAMIKRFQRAGLKVCGWHYVYGDYPAAEARASAVAAQRGADCFVIDAEAEYEGKYAAADRYMRTLRALVGKKYPIALTGFPYVDYHPAFPYSVFLGPGASQVNQPQMYWKAIGVSVRTVFEHTYIHNRLFKRPIRPLGQTYMAPSTRDIKLFRRFSQTYGGAPSWWSWQETTTAGWRALGASTAGRLTGIPPVTSHATLKMGSRGDLVVWAQQHLKRKIAPNIPVTGVFGAQTKRAVRELQRRRGLTRDGILGTETWSHLLRFKPVRVRWWIPRKKTAKPASASASSAGPRLRAPASARMPARAYEIPAKGRGGRG